MKKLILILLAVVCLTAPSFAEEGQVVTIKQDCYAEGRKIVCFVTLKNIGKTAVRNLSFRFNTKGNASYWARSSEVYYFPPQETLDVKVWVDPIDLGISKAQYIDLLNEPEIAYSYRQAE